MNEQPRTRRTFQPDVDSLEGRLVLSPAGAAQAAGVAHLQQLHEQRHLVQVQSAEHRGVSRQLPIEVLAARHSRSTGKKAVHHPARIVVVSPVNSQVLGIITGTPGLPSLPRSSSQGSATGSGASTTRVPLTVIVGTRLTGGIIFGIPAGTGTIVAPPARTSSTPTPTNLTTVITSGGALAGSGTTGGTQSTTTGAGNILFINLPAGGGTILASPGNTSTTSTPTNLTTVTTSGGVVLGPVSAGPL
jgi:hypothetical protein